MHRLSLLLIILVALPGFQSPSREATPTAIAQETITKSTTGIAAGTFERIYDPSVEGESPLSEGPAGSWSWNDHTVIQDADGTWHAFGITDPEQPGTIPSSFGHATSPSLTSPNWTGLPHAMSAKGVDTGPGQSGEDWIWAPHIVESDGTWYTFFAGPVIDPPTPHERYKIQLATSTDLQTWTRYPENPLFEDGFDARDPMVLRVGDQWVMYYTATSEPAGGNHIVAYRTSSDLLTWSDRQVALEHPGTGTIAGATESPFVVEHDGSWYLFTCCGDGVSYLADYTVTNVYRSSDPFHFDYDDKIGTIDAHASEIVRDTDGAYYVTSAGFAHEGLYLAPLEFETERKIVERVVTTDTWRLTIQTEPQTLITSLEVDPDRDGTFVQVLDDDYRGTGPSAAFHPFGDTDRPGPATSINATESSLHLTGIPMGDDPVTVDWDFTFSVDYFDMSFTWHIGPDFDSRAVEMGWYLDTTLPRIGDSNSQILENGDVDDRRNLYAGFPDFAIASGDDMTVVAAYKTGSTLLEGGRYAWNPGGTLVWQLISSPAALPPADFIGGTWRIGASASPDDREFAEHLSASLNE